MATSDDERRMQADEEARSALSSDLSDSENGLSGGEETPSKIEWLATGREKRSTAGNRMKSMLAAEEPDDDLELLFAEDEDDVGFTDVGDDGSDAHMSSSDEEDAQENADDLEGERELEKHARESRQAARKRKAQEAIPLKFRKKVKIDTSQTPSTSATPAPKPPRPRKKSERLSWLPSPADLPTRASKRETTMAGKEQLHKQMAEREIKRLQQIEAMERKAKRLEALKKPPMTQAQRLAEAALVEKRNAKSLNRWEEAEKQREEERKAKLAALNNRTLKGPVVTFWSGVGEWIDGKLKHVGKIVTIEEKPAKKKRHSTVGPEGRPDGSNEDRSSQAENTRISPDKVASIEPDPAPLQQVNAKPESSKEGEAAIASSARLADAEKANPVSSTNVGQEKLPIQNEVTDMVSTETSTLQAASTAGDGEAASDPASHGHLSNHPETASKPHVSPPSDIRPPDLKPPDLQPPSAGLYTTSMFAPPAQSSLMKPSDLKPPSNSFLAPPVGVSQNGLSMPMIGYHSSLTSTTSNVLAPPNPTQRQSPLSMPQTNIHTAPAPTPTHSTQVISIPNPPAPSTPSTTPALPHPRPPKASLGASKSTKANAPKQQKKEAAPPAPPSPPANGKAARNCIILQNFNDNAIKDRSVQTRILFGREMSKLPKHGPAVRCVITNHPAKYRDPRTGLPYYNAYAFKQIQRLYSGEYKWSSLIGAWVGSETSAATGVPRRFLDPDAPGPPKVQTSVDLLVKDEPVADGANQYIEPQTTDKQGTEAPALCTSQSDNIVTQAPAGDSNDNTQVTVGEPPQETNKVEVPSTTSGTNDTAQPHIATTSALFALDSGPGPMTGNANTKIIHSVNAPPQQT
ncbi:YL1 nuclear protein-domain-containing protein [Xylaria venustula]|nr:YL1 nuclear protein-domain-containing protein [Xylaria venustula]